VVVGGAVVLHRLGPPACEAAAVPPHEPGAGVGGLEGDRAAEPLLGRFQVAAVLVVAAVLEGEGEGIGAERGGPFEEAEHRAVRARVVYQLHGVEEEGKIAVEALQAPHEEPVGLGGLAREGERLGAYPHEGEKGGKRYGGGVEIHLFRLAPRTGRALAVDGLEKHRPPASQRPGGGRQGVLGGGRVEREQVRGGLWIVLQALQERQRLGELQKVVIGEGRGEEVGAEERPVGMGLVERNRGVQVGCGACGGHLAVERQPGPGRTGQPGSGRQEADQEGEEGGNVAQCHFQKRERQGPGVVTRPGKAVQFAPCAAAPLYFFLRRRP